MVLGACPMAGLNIGLVAPARSIGVSGQPAFGGPDFAGSGALERDDKKWEPVFVNKSRDNKELDHDNDSIKCHHGLSAGRSGQRP